MPTFVLCVFNITENLMAAAGIANLLPVNVNISVLYNEFGILFTRDRSGLRREIILTRQDPEPKQKPASEDDDMTIHDGISEGRPVMEISS